MQQWTFSNSIISGFSYLGYRRQRYQKEVAKLTAEKSTEKYFLMLTNIKVVYHEVQKSGLCSILGGQQGRYWVGLTLKYSSASSSTRVLCETVTVRIGKELCTVESGAEGAVVVRAVGGGKTSK